MIYTNIFGEEVDTTKRKATKKRKKDFTPSHSGWTVKGASPDEYAKQNHKRNHEIENRKRANAKANAVKMSIPDVLPPFYEWAKTNRSKANPKPFSSHASALECKHLAEKSGWLHVEIIELKKGDVSQLQTGVLS